MLKKLARRLLPLQIRRTLGYLGNEISKWRTKWTLIRLRKKVWDQKLGSQARCLNYTVRITDGPNFYMQYKDEFIQRIYHFETQRPAPFIIDGGSNIGMSILYFKHIYPTARIIGFEPDPEIFRILQENVTHNALEDITLVNAGLSSQPGQATFLSDSSAGGRLWEGERSITVQMERLSNHLNEPVDFLKLNIEGEELPVLQEAANSGKLHNVRELVIEYHGWPNAEQQLGDILNLLDGQGFRYLIHDFDAETCRTSKPPFQLTSQTTWFCLIYARRQDDELCSTLRGS